MNRERRKRVALFIPSLRGGGAERMMLNLAGEFAERGLNVDLILAKAEGPYLAEKHPSVRLIDLKAPRVLFPYRAWCVTCGGRGPWLCFLL